MEVSLYDSGFDNYLQKVKTGVQKIDLVRGQNGGLGEVVAGGPGTTTIQLGPVLLPTREDGLIYSRVST